MCSARDASRERLRQALVAVNADAELSREVVCRLGARPGAWAGGGSGAPSAEDGTVLRLPREALERARSAARRRRETARRQIERAAEHGFEVVTRADPAYPAELLHLELPPPVLFCRGRLPAAPAVAIVGSREAGPYGLEVAERFAAELAAAGLVIVSGLARGVDTAAHRGALAADGGSTIAVLGCGAGRDYPRGSGRLADEIAAGRGAVVTEFPPGFAPLARNFPFRNRIIAALGVGTLVVRAAPRSGSLITARLALELGRDVWAVPGGIFDPKAVGTNALIRDGALLAGSPRHVLESLPWGVRQRLAPPVSAEGASAAPAGEVGSGSAARLLEALSGGEAATSDEAARRAGVAADEALRALLELELAGRVRRLPGPCFVRVGEPWRG